MYSPANIHLSAAQASVQLIFYLSEDPDYIGHSLARHYLQLTAVALVGESTRLPGISTEAG